MVLEHVGMPQPGDCRVVFSASAEELEAAIQAEQAAENPIRILSCWPSTGPKASGRGQSSTACRRWSWNVTPASPSPSSPGPSVR